MTDTHAQGLATHLARLEAQRDQLTEQIESVRGMLLATIPLGGTVTDTQGGTRYQVRPGRRTFSERLARETLPADLLAPCEVRKVDGAALKRQSVALWEMCCTQGDPTLVKVGQR